MGEACKTVLLVEDDPSTRFLILDSFEMANLAVSFQVAKNGLEAVDYLSGKEPYSNRESYPLPVMILTNLNMPGMSGFELLAWVKQHVKKNLPVLVMSATDDPNHVIQAANLGAHSYFIKKLSSFDDLIDIVAKQVL
ncbi:response regulator [Iningainema tapete]|uniref:Response regulator n=1 Tax=Iningainema tapete BLCC-T55 TaxID=2748662 RepID=A0A8J6XEQ3_9CYAN|nr:response regulator [Iningainema tapete]MBD2775130.1 response regulator [Iningainema tapete BLCC-T55]